MENPMGSGILASGIIMLGISAVFAVILHLLVRSKMKALDPDMGEAEIAWRTYRGFKIVFALVALLGAAIPAAYVLFARDAAARLLETLPVLIALELYLVSAVLCFMTIGMFRYLERTIRGMRNGWLKEHGRKEEDRYVMNAVKETEAVRMGYSERVGRFMQQEKRKGGK